MNGERTGNGLRQVEHIQGVGQSMKETYLYLWHPLFQAQWDRYNQRNHQT
jgi:hypothetical protein